MSGSLHLLWPPAIPHHSIAIASAIVAAGGNAMITPRRDTWVNIQDIIRPKFVTSTTAQHFAFCHVRSVTPLRFVLNDGNELTIPAGDVSVIMGSENGAFVLATKRDQEMYSADRVVKSANSFQHYTVPWMNLFHGPYQIYYFKDNLLNVP
jgi:hypothetical protein